MEVGRILTDYEKASGQKINVSKCSITFSSKVSGEMRQNILAGLCMNEVRDQAKYLGLPSHIGRTKKEFSRYI
ncbi:hypothetical protein LIER_36951 [Lithospermum erythrorhizon]|uniref:Reverse transcriptase n=1 Tax=Lithospermum erythrorhizon TaxID=34254 RepID=A0AAV3PHB4_LITER